MIQGAADTAAAQLQTAVQGVRQSAAAGASFVEANGPAFLNRTAAIVASLPADVRSLVSSVAARVQAQGGRLLPDTIAAVESLPLEAQRDFSAALALVQGALAQGASLPSPPDPLPSPPTRLPFLPNNASSPAAAPSTADPAALPATGPTAAAPASTPVATRERSRSHHRMVNGNQTSASNQPAQLPGNYSELEQPDSMVSQPQQRAPLLTAPSAAGTVSMPLEVSALSGGMQDPEHAAFQPLGGAPATQLPHSASAADLPSLPAGLPDPSAALQGLPAGAFPLLAGLVTTTPEAALGGLTLASVLGDGGSSEPGLDASLAAGLPGLSGGLAAGLEGLPSLPDQLDPSGPAAGGPVPMPAPASGPAASAASSGVPAPGPSMAAAQLAGQLARKCHCGP